MSEGVLKTLACRGLRVGPSKASCPLGLPLASVQSIVPRDEGRDAVGTRPEAVGHDNARSAAGEQRCCIKGWLEKARGGGGGGALNRCHLSNWRLNPETVHFLSSKGPFLPTMFVSKC